MGRKYQAQVVPELDRRICGSICLCQLTMVTSCVALVYLTVAIYIPSHKAFQSGIEPLPIACQTINTALPKTNCSWASCGEWCLTKTSGFCPQIMVTARRNGTDITVHNCSRLQTVPCPPVDTSALKKYNCNNGSECGSLTGLFNCSLGHCANWTGVFQCYYRADGQQLDSEKDNMKMTGFFECHKSRCTRIRQDFQCDRYCSNITTANMNVYLLHDNFVHTGECNSVLALSSANGTDPGFDIEPREIWSKANNSVLVASCRSVARMDDGTGFKAIDCVNGTLLEWVPQPAINFTTLWSMSANKTLLVDPSQRFLPLQAELTIYNSTKLFINLDGCVNTLKGECKEFLEQYGKDGRNQTGSSRFPCYYDKNNAEFVIARFDLEKTWRELLVAVVVPSVMFVVSSAALCVITRSVKVGDDGRMRCKYCSSAEVVEEDEMAPTRNNTSECLLPDNNAS